MRKKYTTPSKKDLWSRDSLIKVIESALDVGENRFASRLSLLWLASFPGDMEIKFLQSKALARDGMDRQAIPILKNLLSLDPEYLDAQSLLVEIGQKFNMKGIEGHKNSLIALKSDSSVVMPPDIPREKWPYSLAKIRNDQANGDRSKAAARIQDVLASSTNIPLTGITHLQILRTQGNIAYQSIQSFAELYHKRWPDCIQFMLIWAEALIAGGESDKAVAILHKAASLDVIGQVSTRLWGADHAYKNLWPQKLEALIPIQIPSSISVQLGWNLLSFSGYQKFSDSVLDKQDSKQNSLEILENKVSIPKISKAHKTSLSNNQSQSTKSQDIEIPTATEPDPPQLTDHYPSRNAKKKGPNTNGRFPIYVIFTTQRGMTNKYGPEKSSLIDQSMRKLVSSIRRRMDWGAMLIYADDPSSMAQHRLKPALYDDPWQLKLALADLDHALGKKGAKIGAVLIIGGPEIVPFHNLPNPTDDADAHVPSDNPYSTSDANYFVPEWPVGRLPGGTGNDPGLIISSLGAIAETHAKMKDKRKVGLLTLWYWLLDFLFSRRSSRISSFGYTAEAWKKASRSVFRPIGDPHSLITSPPVTLNKKQPLPISKLGYFNLHGVVDSPEWFGQKDPGNDNSDTDYPTAIHPKDVLNSGRSPKIIFSEACYGANIQDKSVESALALKFLASGTQALVGSTVISYGSISTPLNAADLLGKAFWNYFREGNPAGEALQKAKIFLASEMHRRQGYLDGEDQKTLISFVLFGDPLAKEMNMTDWLPRKSKLIAQPLEEIYTVCDRVETPGTSEPIPKEIVENVRTFVDQYLPGMKDSQLSLSHEHAECFCQGHTCPTGQLSSKNKPNSLPARRVITLSKQYTHARKVREIYARMTFDRDGKIVKLAVSR